MSAYLIGIDAGGTRSIAISYTLEGIEIARASGDFGNPLVDPELAIHNICKTVFACAPKEGTCLMVYAGIAGCEGSTLLTSLPGELARCLRAMGLDSSVKVVGDARFALEAHMGESDGILLIAGTGSIAYGQSHGVVSRVGGWGNLLGDQGSGYDIAKRAVMHLLHEVDQGLPESAFSSAIRLAMNAETVRDCVDRFHRSTKGENAALSLIVDRLARTGDPIACGLLLQVGQDLALLVYTLHKRLLLPPSFPLATIGGVIHNAFSVRQTVTELLQSQGLTPDFLPTVSPQWAVVRAFSTK